MSVCPHSHALQNNRQHCRRPPWLARDRMGFGPAVRRRRRRLPQPKHARRTGVTGVSAPALEQRPDAEQSPTFSPPGYATSRLRPASESRVLLYANAIYRMSPKLSSVDKADRKNNFRPIIYGHNPANLAKICPIHDEMIGLKGIVTSK